MGKAIYYKSEVMNLVNQAALSTINDALALEIEKESRLSIIEGVTHFVQILDETIMEEKNDD
jgi:hypothetical protein